MSAVDERQQLQSRLAEHRAESRRHALDQPALAWLAMLPEWTVEFAEACEFPAGAGGVTAMLGRAESAGLCAVRRELGIDDRERVRFRMRSELRATLFEEWRRLGEVPVEEARKVAQSVLSAPEDALVEAPVGSLRWAELALSELSSRVATGEALTERVQRALERGNPGVAGEWLKAGEALGGLLGGEMERSAARAGWRLSRHHRMVRDAGYLGEFVPRREQLEEIAKLFAETPEWAVHFIGQSGVGKTMLMRHLTSLPAAHGEEAPEVGVAARIDFDYIDPHFPLESPSRLLSELAEDLAGTISNAEQEACYLAFGEAVAGFEASSPPPSSEPLAVLDSNGFKRVVGAFGAFVKSLPQPALFILDTCEELAKLHPPGADVPSIEAMFGILERVHAAAPRVRVVFAGRRWLTPEAANELRGLAVPPAVKGLAPRPFMRMHAVRGFTNEEAERYLREVRPIEISDAMVEAVLRNTRDRGRPASFGEAEEEQAEEERFSPNDVALYGRWIESEPDLRPSDLAGGNFDVYVEVRIFRRLGSPEVLEAIPAAVLLERFDWATIAPALGGTDSARARRALDGLLEQEWTHLEGGPGREEIVLSVDAGLLPRLRDYFERTPERWRQLERARELLTPAMERLLRLPCAALRPDQVDGALRVLEPRAAVVLWDALADRAAYEGEWSWAVAVCSLLLSPEREPPLPIELLASVGALYVGALDHHRSAGDLNGLRLTVRESAEFHPDPKAARALETRARLGLLREAVLEGDFAVSTARTALTRGRLLASSAETAPAVGPALLAALEALIDANEERDSEIPDNAGVCFATLRPVFAVRDDETTYAYLLALRGRLHALCGDAKRARKAFDRLERLPLEDTAAAGFADWVPPESSRHRALLELLRFRLADGSETAKLLERCEDAALAAAGGVDAARLLSLALQARLARGDLSERRTELAERFEQAVGSYRAVSPAHRVAPPLFVSVAECRLALGRPGEALELLQAREREIAARHEDDDASRAAVLATIRALRRQRLAERFALISSVSLSEHPAVRAEAMAAGSLVAGLPPPRGKASAADHAAWRARCLLDPRGGEEAIEAIRRADPRSEHGRKRYRRTLDRAEAALVWRSWTRRGRRAASRARRDAARLSAEEGMAPSIREPLGEEGIRLSLRRAALVEKQAALSGVPESKRSRQLGRLALEEGELMALRLPARAAVLLDLARHQLRQADDRPGVFAATLRRAIALVHAGSPGPARAMRSDVYDAYERLRELEPRLPALERVRAGEIADTPDLEPWVGWTRRLAEYLAWCNGTTPPRDVTALSLEPEMALMPAVGADDTEVPLKLSRISPFVTTLTAVVAGAIVFGAAVGLFTDSLEVAAQGTIGVFLGSLAIGVVFALLASAFEAVAVRASWAPHLPVDAFELSLVLSDRRPERFAEIEGRLEPWARRRRVKLVLWALRLVSFHGRWTATFPLDEGLLERGPPRALREALAAGSGRGFVPVRLAVAAGLAPIAWERWLVGDLAEREDLSPAELPQIWRVRSQSHTPVARESWSSTVSTICSAVWRPFVDASAVRGVGWAQQPGLLPAGATIAIGLPTFTRAGWRLRLDEELPVPGEGGDGGSRDLVSSDLLAIEAPIVIVIGRPGGEAASEVGFADGLRGFANETFLAGAHAVISIPSLPSAVVSEVIFELTDGIASWDRLPEHAQLNALVTAVRGRIYESAHGPGAELSPATADRMLDVCLFAPR